MLFSPCICISGSDAILSKRCSEDVGFALCSLQNRLQQRGMRLSWQQHVWLGSPLRASSSC